MVHEALIQLVASSRDSRPARGAGKRDPLLSTRRTAVPETVSTRAANCVTERIGMPRANIALRTCASGLWTIARTLRSTAKRIAQRTQPRAAVIMRGILKSARSTTGGTSLRTQSRSGRMPGSGRRQTKPTAMRRCGRGWPPIQIRLPKVVSGDLRGSPTAGLTSHGKSGPHCANVTVTVAWRVGLTHSYNLITSYPWPRAGRMRSRTFSRSASPATPRRRIGLSTTDPERRAV